MKHLYQRGARIVQPAYNEDNNDELKTRFAGGADRDDQRLTKAGRTLIQGLLDQFILVDLSHVGRKSALEIINMALKENRPVTANHANAIGVYDDRPDSEACPGGCVSRNHTDDVICGIARTGGVIGFTPIRFMFAPKVGDTYMKATENDFIRHLNYVAKQLKCTSKGGKKGRRIDMTRHISLGSDGRMNGYDKRVAWLYMKMGNRLDRWKRIATRLKNECGYSMKEISALISGNLERVYRESLPGVMRPVTTRPRSNERVSTRTVEFRWKRPVVNQPKWRLRPIDTISTPRSFQLIIERKTNGNYTRVKNLKLGDVLRRRVNLETGAYRWFVKAKGSRVDINSRWQYFKRI